MELSIENVEQIADYVCDVARENMTLLSAPELKIDIFIKNGKLEHSDPISVSQNTVYPKGSEVIYTIEGSFFETIMKDIDRREVVADYLNQKGTLPDTLEKKIDDNRKDLMEYAEGVKDLKEISPSASDTVSDILLHFMLNELHNEVYGYLTDMIYERDFETRQR